MPHRFISRACAAACTTLLVGSASAVTLYDPALGLPTAQQWVTTGFGSFSTSLTGDHYRLSTAPINGTVAGSALLAPQLLDTAAGFSLDFDLRIDSESHVADNQRAGFSLVVTGVDPTHALEVGFWQSEVFAYGPTFVPGAAASFDTSVDTRYSLVVSQNQYSLFGNGSPLLAGALVDYTGRGIAPYTTGGVIFFGDDTSRAQSVSELRLVTLTTPVPEPSTGLLLAGGLAGLWAVRRRRTAA